MSIARKMLYTGIIDSKRLQEREDLDLLFALNEIFRHKRGYVIKIPKQGEAVIACMSGGLDSIANLAILLVILKVKVYPFFIARKQTNYKYEKEAVDYFDDYFSKHYPNLYYHYIEIEMDIPSKAYKADLIKTKHLLDDEEKRARASYPARNPIIFLAGMEYAYSLQHKGVYPKTIFGAFHTEDNAFHSSLTSIRLQNLLMCNVTGDWEWQYISIPTELELGNYYSKSRLVKFASECGIPLEHTRSCTSGDPIQCGLCTMACKDRRLAFKRAGVEDKTQYQHPFPKDDNGWILTK